MTKAKKCAYLKVQDWPRDDRKRWSDVEYHPQAEGWKSPRTFQVYEDAYGHFLGYLIEMGRVLGPLPRGGRVTPEEVKQYVEYLRLRVRASTVAKRVQALCWMAPIFSESANSEDFRDIVRFVRRFAEKAEPRKPVMSDKGSAAAGFQSHGVGEKRVCPQPPPARCAI